MSSPRVVIVGAGAAGVFAAYRLHTMAPGAYEIVLVEKNDRVGGNARSTTVQFGGKDYSIDCGAQFFYGTPQPTYVALLAELGLFDSPSEIDARATGITLWDGQTNERRLWIPSRLGGFARYDAKDWERMIGFGKFLAYAFLLDRDRPEEWGVSVGDWLQSLSLLDSQFKDEVLRPFLYQFLTLPADRIDEGSALYAVTYFVRNVFGEPGVDEPDPGLPSPAGATFQVYQSHIGLDGILERALEATGVTPRLGETVTAVTRNADGTLSLTTAVEQIQADHVVFATDPQVAAAILTAGAFPAPGLIASLQACEYANLAISMQSGGSCWMPGDQSFWEPVNTIVDGDALRFSVWFGPLRDTFDGGDQIPVFKSWASPDLVPATCPHTFMELSHRIVMPTTAFMMHRQAVLDSQGDQNIWFAGGWTTWFDSQEAALDSGTSVAQHLAGAGRAAPAVPRPVALRRRLDHWLTRVAAHAPADQRVKLKNLVKEIDAAE